MTFKIFPNAKINLGLNILSKRSDGYHNIETIFIPIDLKDELVIDVDNPTKREIYLNHERVFFEKNTLDLLLEILEKKFDIPKVGYVLTKHIPFGAGLGGGSADAAFLLSFLNDYFNLKLNFEQLREIASNVGADCVFFLLNKPAIAVEKGDLLRQIDVDLSDYKFLIFKPIFSISTKEAYSQVVPMQPEYVLAQVVRMPIEKWKLYLKNDFEKFLFDKYPLLKQVKQTLYDIGAVYASLSGSGSTVYGIFRKDFQINLKPLKSFSFELIKEVAQL